MNRISDARTALFGAINTVLPGRVASTPPASTPYPTPYIWIDQPDGNLGFAGTATKLTVASFPIWIGYDGAVRAQVAGLDELVAGVWDACQQVRQATPQNWSAQTIDVGGAVVRGVVVLVDVTIGSMTLCLPTPTTSFVPPEPIPA